MTAVELLQGPINPAELAYLIFAWIAFAATIAAAVVLYFIIKELE